MTHNTIHGTTNPDPSANPALPPPQPPDPQGIRPPLNLPHLWLQVVLIQLGIEERAALKAEKEKEPSE